MIRVFLALRVASKNTCALVVRYGRLRQGGPSRRTLSYFGVSVGDFAKGAAAVDELAPLGVGKVESVPLAPVVTHEDDYTKSQEPAALRLPPGMIDRLRTRRIASGQLKELGDRKNPLAGATLARHRGEPGYELVP